MSNLSASSASVDTWELSDAKNSAPPSLSVPGESMSSWARAALS